MDRIDLLKTFLVVSSESSFTKAAEKLNTSNQLVSKYINKLEEHLGARLLNRTTRSVHLTEAGEYCFQQAQQILESISDLEGHFGQLQSDIQGRLRISVPVSFAILHLAPLIRDFQKQYPAVNIDLQLNDRKVDVIEEGYDVALRIGHLKDSSLIAKEVTPVRLVLCASPDYLKRYGTPSTPSQLIPQHYLRYSYIDYHQSQQPLMDALKSKSHKSDSVLEVNNGQVLSAAAIAGEGYVLQPTFIVSEAVKRGQLKIILKQYEPSPLKLFAVYPHRKLLAPKLRAFIDFLSKYYGDTPYWDDF